MKEPKYSVGQEGYYITHAKEHTGKLVECTIIDAFIDGGHDIVKGDRSYVTYDIEWVEVRNGKKEPKRTRIFEHEFDTHSFRLAQECLRRGTYSIIIIDLIDHRRWLVTGITVGLDNPQDMISISEYHKSPEEIATAFEQDSKIKFIEDMDKE